MKNKQPNILWYCSDQQRYDTIRALGQKHIDTPMLDELCASGVAFSQAYTQSQICTPARTSFLTGRYPASHHVYRNGNAWFPSHEKLVTRLFADAGYDCGLVGKLHLTAAKYYEKRPDDGYRSFLWSHHPHPDFAHGHDYENWLRHEMKVDPVELYAPHNQFCGPGVPAKYHQTTWVSEMAIRFITEQRDKPWLLSLNPFDPHAPFDAPPEYLAKINMQDLPMPLFRPTDIERQKDFAAIDQQTKIAIDPYLRQKSQVALEKEHDLVASAAPDSYDALEIKANYYAMIMLIDDQLRRIVDVLRDTNQLENTIIVYMSDHGELLGDHGLILKGCRFFEGLVHIPMIFSWPQQWQSNLQSQALVESVDVAPTLLEAAGLEVPRYMQGKSLHSLLKGQAPQHAHKKHVISEFKDSIGGPQHSDHSHGSMVFDGQFKSVVYHGHRIGELYDLKNDPGDFNNLWDVADAQSLKLDRLKYHMDAMMATISAGPERNVAY